MTKAMVPKGQLRVYIIKVVNAMTCNVVYANAVGGGTHDIEKAQRFTNREQVDAVAAEINGIVGPKGIVTVEDVTLCDADCPDCAGAKDVEEVKS